MDVHTSLPFFIHHLDPNVKARVNRELLKIGVTLPRTYSSDVYGQLSRRLRSVYDRNQQYPTSFINSWKIATRPGFIIYAADREKFHISHSVNKKSLNSQQAELYISKGTVVIFFGDLYLRGFECYITSKRRAELHANDEFALMPAYSEKDCVLGLNSPFSENIRILKVGCAALLAKAPAYLSSLDTIIGGDNIFSQQGELILPKILMQTVQRIICAISYRDTIKISSIEEVSEIDVLCNPPLCLVPKKYDMFYKSLWEYFKRNNLPIVGETGLTTFSIDLKHKNYRIDTFLSASRPIMFDPSKGMPPEALPYLFLTSYAHTVQIDAEELKETVALTPLHPVVRVVSDSLFSNALQMRKTFLAGNEMGYIVIANKGSMKTIVTGLLAEFKPEIIVIDSDVYGRWVTEKVLGRDVDIKSLNTDDSEVVPYFEVIASELLQNKSLTQNNRLHIFKNVFAKVISDPVHGTAAYQDAIYAAYGTTQVLLFCHTTIEANIMSGKWQQMVIRPINNTLKAVMERKRANRDENVFLYCAYQALTPMHNRAAIPWVDFFMLIAPEIIDVLNKRFHPFIREAIIEHVPE
nr:MAG: hypothetical protein [Reoviridae sp.]